MRRREFVKRLGLLAPLALCPPISILERVGQKGTKPPVDAPMEKVKELRPFKEFTTLADAFKYAGRHDYIYSLGGKYYV